MKGYQKCSFILIVLLICGMFLLSGCGSTTTGADDQTTTTADDKGTIKIGACANSILMAQSAKEILEGMGYTVEFTTFDDFFLPDTALAEGSIDANFYQHKPFMDSYNESKGTNIVMVKPMYNYYTALYSKVASALDELPDGGKIGLDNDATNLDQNLRLLDKWGVIKLTDEEKDLYSLMDIVDNPKNFEFVQLDPNPKVAAYNDGELVAMVNASCTVFTAGLNPTENIIFKDVDSTYALGICVNGDQVDSQMAQDLIAAYTSDEAMNNVAQSYQGAYEPVQ